MKRYISRISSLTFAVAAGLLLLTSCGDFLDKLPDERIELDGSNLTDEQVTSLLAGAYPGANYGWIGEISSDNIIDNNASHLPASPLVDQKETHLNMSSMDRGDDEMFRFDPCESEKAQDSPSYIWEDEYSSIAMCNAIIDVINDYAAQHDGKLSAIMRSGRAEAKLLRAYCHFILVNIFCQAYKDDEASKHDLGIPYVYEQESTVSVAYDRGNVADVYKKIEQDLLEGLAELDDSHMQKPKWHFNLSAAHAFAARFYLFYHKYDKVVEHANAVLGAGQGNLPNLLLNYEPFAKCVYMNDVGNCFQNPSSSNNLMLLSTMSYNLYHAIGYRYAMNGEAARGVFFHATPTSGPYTVILSAFSSGQALSYSSENADYGYYSGKIWYLFEYTDKVAGTGYAHLIRREFTCNHLLLERAEAQTLLGNYDEAAKDLIAYEVSLQTIDPVMKQSYQADGAMKPLTQAMIESWYADTSHENTLDMSADGWGNAVHMGINIPAAALPYMNCINDYRRYETMWEGLRFFDLKRWGLKWKHVVGYGASKQEYVLDWNDLRRAVEVPLDARSAGLESSRSNRLVESNPKAELRAGSECKSK